MKAMVITLLLLALTGCVTKTETVYIDKHIKVYPPDAYVVECVPVAPEVPSVGNVIASLQSTVLQCNKQLNSIRIWMDHVKEEKEP